MRMIDEFAKKVMETTESFEITRRNRHNVRCDMFIQSKVGKARYVYSGYSFCDPNVSRSLNDKYDFCAIVSDGKIYVKKLSLMSV